MTRMVKAALMIALTAASATAVPSAEAATRITKIEFTGKSKPHQIMITGDGPIEFEKLENAPDNQIILELKNAKLANANVGRRIDASSFNSKVSLISPYNVESQNAVRVIVQLREGAETPAVTAGNKLFVGIDGQPDPAVIAAASEMDAVATPSRSAPTETAASEPEALSDSSASGSTGAVENYGNASGRGKDGASMEARVAQVTDAQATRKYVGSRVTIQVKEAAISDVFRLIGEASGFNVVLGSDVTGNVTLALVDVPWDLALDTLLSMQKLGAQRRGNILRVATLATLTQEKQLEQTAKEVAQKSAPRVTRIIPINYANPANLVPILQKFGGGAAGTTEGNRDTIVLDERTNSFVIQDIPENIERMSKMIELLDKPTPQVLIETKIIEATEEFAKGIGGNVALAKQTVGNNYLGASASNGTLTNLLSGNPFPDQGDGTAASNLIAAGFSLSRITNGRLQALLSFSESESKSKIISTPRTLVLNRQSSTIVQGTPILVPVTVLNATTGLPTTSNEVQQANLSLTVKPTVTNDGNVIMDLSISSDTPKQIGEGQSGIGKRNIKTQVVAESGTTLVIGGVYQTRDSKGEAGFPGLRKIPIIGRLFGSETTGSSRSELLIFVSPKIVNEDEISPDSKSANGSGGDSAPTNVDALPGQV